MLTARLGALRFISQTIRSVLKEAASEALRRLLMERLEHIKNNKLCDDEDETSTELVVDELPVYPSDIDHSYQMAVRLGEKWEEKLLEAGENDAASIVRDVLCTGRFLEMDVRDDFPMPIHSTQDSSKPNEASQHQSNQTLPYSFNSNQGGHKATTFGVLQNLGWKWDLSQSMDQAFPSEIKPSSTQWKPLPKLNPDSSGLYIPKAAILSEHEIKPQHPQQLFGYPAPFITMSHAQNHRPLVTNTDQHQDSGFYRDQIDLIDAAFGDADENNRPTSWYHGWDCIQRAANKNRDRMYLETIAGRKRKILKSDEAEGLYHEILPRTMVNQAVANANASSSESNAQEDSIVATGGDSERVADFTVVPVVNVISTRTRVAHLLDDQRQSSLRDTSLQRMQQHGVHSSSVREPSSMSSNSWTMEEIIHELSDMDKLVLKTMIHGEIADEHLRESQYHQVQGALKHLGLIHLWEQTRSGNCALDDPDLFSTSLDHDDKRFNKIRAKIVRKARKMRLWPHTLEKSDKTGGKQPNSKVMWTESLHHDGGTDGDTNNHVHKYWMELDLGECMLHFMSPDHDSVNKTAMAFRSLEISALVE